jgi:hypothetical protein
MVEIGFGDLGPISVPKGTAKRRTITVRGPYLQYLYPALKIEQTPVRLRAAAFIDPKEIAVI